MRDTAKSVYIKNTFKITENVDRGLHDHKQAFKDLRNAQQRFKENLTRMDGKNGR